MTKQKERDKVIPEVHLFLLKENKVLLLRRSNTGYEDGKWHLVAGHVDNGEAPKECMVRETQEEVGIKIQFKDLEVVHVMHRKQGKFTDRIAFFIKCEKFSGDPSVMENDKHDKIGWYSIAKLPKPMMPYVTKAIGYIKKRIFYSEEEI